MSAGYELCWAPGPMELVILLVIVLVIFGAGKLPQVGSSLGSAIRDFKKSVNDKDEEEAPKTNGDNGGEQGSAS